MLGINTLAEQPPLLSVELCDASLRDVGLAPGAILYFTRTRRFQVGDLVAVETPDGFFIKFIYLDPDGRVRLEGAHPACAARYYSIFQLAICGVRRGPLTVPASSCARAAR